MAHSRDIYTTCTPPTTFELAPEVAYNFEKNYALVIGVDTYGFGKYPSLECAVADAEAIGKSLVEDLGFPQKQVILLKNEEAELEKIETILEGLAERLEPEDNFLLYFSGHGGKKDKPNQHASVGKVAATGYWVVWREQRFFYSNLLTDFLPYFKNRHVLVMADCCYSGRLLNVNRMRSQTVSVPQNYLETSRLILTSGADHPVPDEDMDCRHSPFANRLLEFIKHEKEPSFCATELYVHLTKNGKLNCRFGPYSSDHSAGEYWLIRKSAYLSNLAGSSRREEEAKRQAERRKDLRRQLLEACRKLDLSDRILDYYKYLINHLPESEPEVLELERVLDDWRRERLPSRYVERILMPPTPVSAEGENDRRTHAYGKADAAGPPHPHLPPGGKNRRTMGRWLSFPDSVYCGIHLDAFKIAAEPVTYNQFKDFVDSQWYFRPADRKDVSLWERIWTECGVDWHTRRDNRGTDARRFNRYVRGSTWYEAVAYCNWLTWRQRGCEHWAYDEGGEVVPAKGYRLPLGIELEAALSSNGLTGVPNCTWEWSAVRHVVNYRYRLRILGRGGGEFADLTDGHAARAVYNTGGNALDVARGNAPANDCEDMLFRVVDAQGG